MPVELMVHLIHQSWHFGKVTGPLVNKEELSIGAAAAVPMFTAGYVANEPAMAINTADDCFH